MIKQMSNSGLEIPVFDACFLLKNNRNFELIGLMSRVSIYNKKNYEQEKLNGNTYINI